MQGKLSTATNIHKITGIRYYVNDQIFKDVPLKRVHAEEMVMYERRCLLYPYITKLNDEPYVVGYFSSFNVIKIFVPKNVRKITPLDIEGNVMEGVDGVFYDPSIPAMMREYANDKFVLMLESSTGQNLDTYFIDLHENNNIQAHREDFELYSNNLQKVSLINKYMMEDYLKTNPADILDSRIIGSDASCSTLGTLIRPNNEGMPLPSEEGEKTLGFLLTNTFAMNYFGSMIGSGYRLVLDEMKKDELYGKWVADLNKVPDKPLIWNKSIWTNSRENI